MFLPEYALVSEPDVFLGARDVLAINMGLCIQGVSDQVPVPSECVCHHRRNVCLRFRRLLVDVSVGPVRRHVERVATPLGASGADDIL